MATALSTWTIDPVLDFIEGRWEEDVLPTLTRYIEIPAKSPAFDPQWAEHGYMEDAVKLMEAWAVYCQRTPSGAAQAEMKAHKPPATTDVPIVFDDGWVERLVHLARDARSGRRCARTRI